MSDKTKDDVTGVETTGHEWDGIEELNNPLPRWWLWTFYGTIIWGVIYTILFPAWPLVDRATGGLMGFSTREQVAEAIADAEAANAEQRAALIETDLTALRDDAELHSYAVNAGAAVFRTWCAQCHGSGAAGFEGYPNLLDNAWLWGGTIENHLYHRGARHPQRGRPRRALFRDASLRRHPVGGRDRDARHPCPDMSQGTAPDAGPGGELFVNNCAACHGEDGKGDHDLPGRAEPDRRNLAVWQRPTPRSPP